MMRTARLGECRQGSLALCGVACSDDDAGASLRQALRHAEADAAIAAGDDGNAAFEVEELQVASLRRGGVHLLGALLELARRQVLLA